MHCTLPRRILAAVAADQRALGVTPAHHVKLKDSEQFLKFESHEMDDLAVFVMCTIMPAAVLTQSLLAHR